MDELYISCKPWNHHTKEMYASKDVMCKKYMTNLYKLQIKYKLSMANLTIYAYTDIASM